MRPQVVWSEEIELPAPGPAEKESPRAIYVLIGRKFSVGLVVLSIGIAICECPLPRWNGRIAKLLMRAMFQLIGEASMEARQAIVSCLIFC